MIKDTILKHLDLQLPLPRLKIPGMPSMISVSEARLAIVSQKKGSGYEVVSGVTGTLDVDFAGKKHDFGFNVLAIRGGHANQLKLQASTKDKISLDLVRRLDLTKVNLSVTRKSGKWAAALSAETKFNNKSAKVTLTQTGKGEDIAVVDTKLKLADLIPGGASIPGLTDVTFTRVALFPDYFEVRGSVKGMDMVVVVFKHQGKRYIATNVLKDFDIGSFIPGVKGTPLDDAKFDNMVFIWAPRGGAVKGLDAAALTPDIETPVKAVAQKVDLKPGVNVIGRMVIARNSKIGKMLNTVGAYKGSVPLIGNLSPKIFHPGSASQFKNEILDNLDFKVDLPKLNLPGMSKVANIRKTHLVIMGTKDGNRRGIDVDVAGELDVRAGGKTVAFDFDVEIKKQAGKPDQVKFIGKTEPGETVSVSMIERVTLSNLSIIVLRQGSGWGWQLTGQSTFRSKRLTINLENTPTNHKSLSFGTYGMSLGEIAGFPNLPVLGDIKANWIVMQKNNMLVDMTIKGIGAELMLYKPEGASKYHAGFAMGEFSPTAFIPDTSNTPLKDVSFKELVFIYNPTKAVENTTLNKLPLIFASRMPQSPNNVAINPGLNVFGHLDVHPTGELATLLKDIGITDLSLPLNGGFSPKVFAKNISSSAIKNEILDHLDINVQLPKLAMPGMSKIADIKHTVLTVKGVDKGGKRGLKVDVAGALEVKLQGKTTPFDYEVDILKPAGKPAQILLQAAEEKGRTLTVDMIEKITLSNVKFTMDNAPGHWRWYIQADTKVRNTPINVYYNSTNYISVNTRLTIGQIIDSPGLPGLDDAELDSIDIYPGRWFIHGKVKGASAYFEVQKAKSGAGHLIAAYLYNLSLADMIPGAGSTPLKDVGFSNVVALYSPAKQATTLSNSGLAGDAIVWIHQSNPNPTIKPGLNIFGHLDVHPTGEMAKLLKDVGITELKLPLNGGFSPKAFSKNISGTAIKNAILDNLDVKVNLPPLRVPEIDRFLTFNNAKLAIKGKTPDGKRGLDVALLGDADLKVKGDTVGFAVDVEYDRSGGNSELKFKGKTEKKWTHPLGIKFLDLEKLTLSIDKKTKATGASTFDIKMTANTDIGSHSKLDVTVDVHEKNGTVTDAYFELDGPLQLSEIPGVKDIPNSSHFTIDTIKVSEHGIEAKTDFGGKKDLDILLFTGSGWNLIVRQDNFTITEIVPPLKDTPLKHVVLSEAAIVLSTEGLSGQMSGFSVIAQDALKDIYGKNAANIDVEPLVSG